MIPDWKIKKLSVKIQLKGDETRQYYEDLSVIKKKTVKKVSSKQFVTCCRMTLWLGAFLTSYVITTRL